MESSELPPLPYLKKRGKKRGHSINRSRSFVAEMFHISNPNNITHKKWSNNDMQLLQKMGLEPDKHNELDRDKLKISPNLHPDLQKHAYEEQINSLANEVQLTKNNLMRAAEYGQHLIEENEKWRIAVEQLKNEAAEYIAQLCELRNENAAMQMECQGNEYSVNDYEDKMLQYKAEREEMDHKVFNIHSN